MKGAAAVRRSVGKWAYILIFTCCVGATAFLIWRENLPGKEIVVSTEIVAENPEQTAGDRVYVDLNTADAGTLQVLPGIGSVIAERIVEYRQKNGAFRTKEEVKQVSGIGDKTYEMIVGLITVGGSE